MSFDYKRRSADELEEIAAVVLSRFTKRCSGYFVDIEGIVEDCGLTIIPRQGGLRKHVEGYVAANPHYIVVPEQLSVYAGRYRPVISEEFCHAVLEYDFLSKGNQLPSDAQPHALSNQQHEDIESNARYLALAILFPKENFIQRFNECLKIHAKLHSDRGALLRSCAERLEHTFHVWSLGVAYRARDLGLISEEECRKHFSDRIPL